MRRIPRHRPSPALVVACLALTVALGGTSYAAVTLPRNSVGTPQLKRNAVNSAKVKNFSLLRADFKRGQVPAGPRGLQGLPGATGATGAPGAKGDQGVPGPFPGTLPAGKTIRGVWVALDHASAANEEHQVAISYGFQLASAPVLHHIKAGIPPPAECPGTGANPQAQPGHLCLFETFASNVTASRGVQAVSDPRSGAEIHQRATAAGNSYTFGSWAVTSAAGAGPAGAASSASRVSPGN